MNPVCKQATINGKLRYSDYSRKNGDLSAFFSNFNLFRCLRIFVGFLFQRFFVTIETGQFLTFVGIVAEIAGFAMRVGKTVALYLYTGRTAARNRKSCHQHDNDNQEKYPLHFRPSGITLISALTAQAMCIFIINTLCVSDSKSKQ